jgi:glycine C-acetyltransferase
VVAACIAAIGVLETEPQHVANLWKNTEYFRKAVQDLGFDTGNSQTPIIPIMTGESRKAKDLSNSLYDKGIFVTPIVYPIVAKDKARIRVQMNAELDRTDLDRAIEALEETAKDLRIV